MSTNLKEQTTAIVTLTLARDLLTKRNAWTRGTYARAPGGYPVEVEDPRATQFCMLGALVRVSPQRLGMQHALTALDRVLGASVHHFNDKQARSKADVLAAFDLAIEVLRDE